MTNDEVYLALKKEGIKEAVKGFIANVAEDNWAVFTQKGNVFLLNDNFFIKYSLNPIFGYKDGNAYFKEWQPEKFKKNIVKKRMKEKITQ